MARTTETRELEAAAVEIEAEHRALGAALTRLESVTDHGFLAPALGELRDLLTAHFAREEGAGGLYEKLGAISPHQRDRLRGLVADHVRILATVRSLEKQASEGGGAEVLGKARGLKLILAEHEAHESQLVEAARRG
jgi:hypothetical protein